MSTQGVVVNFSQRDWNGKTLYSALLDVNGSENWFGLGEKAPEVQKGDLVEFEVEKKGRYNNVKGGVMNVKTKASPIPASNGRGTAWQQKEGYWQEKAERDLVNDARYNMRAACMMAKDVVLALYAQGDIKVPAKATALEVVLNMVDAVAADYYSRWMGLELEEPSPVPDDEPADTEEAF